MRTVCDPKGRGKWGGDHPKQNVIYPNAKGGVKGKSTISRKKKQG